MKRSTPRICGVGLDAIQRADGNWIIVVPFTTRRVSVHVYPGTEIQAELDTWNALYMAGRAWGEVAA